MSDVQAPDCKIFVDADIAETELLGIVMQMLLDEKTVRCEADVLRNDDYDSARRRQFPGGFVYFRYLIDLYVEDAPVKAKAALVGRLLETLWGWGFPAVAACAYESKLPRGGGYKRRDLPWPA